jgi:hypothetical protein
MDAMDIAEKKIQQSVGARAEVATIDTQVGRLSYGTDNLLDRQIMETFSECIQNVQPSVLIEKLEAIYRR